MKYRLIKKYPGSPNLGFVVYEQEKDLWISGTCEQFTKCDINTIKNFPEFWEPVDELEEKILKIIKEQIIPHNSYSMWRYAPEYAANQIYALIKDKLK